MKTDGQKDANEIFLQKIEESKDKGKWNTLINTLKQQDYEMLGKLLTGEPVNSDRERYVKIVELLTSTIINKMDPVALLAHLVREGCLNDRDKQNIECAKRELGCIDATELLLCRVTRLKDDWFRGFMISLRCLGMEDLMSEVDPDYTKKMLEESENWESPNSLELSAPRVHEAESDKADETSGTTPDHLASEISGAIPMSKESDEDDLVSASTTATLPLRDYQREWYDAVSTGQNTLLLGPRQSGKKFVAVKLIQGLLSRTDSPRDKVAYISSDPKKIMHMGIRCQSVLGPEMMTVIQGSGPSNQRLDEILRKHSFLLMTGKTFHCALKGGTVSFGHFSLVIVELGLDYFCKDKHVYKEMMSYFHRLKAGSASEISTPQILLISASMCGNGTEETDMFEKAMETCADFDIEKTSFVEETVGSLRKCVAMPLAERTPVPDRQSNAFAQTVEELMFLVEATMERKHKSLGQEKDYPIPKMSELSNAPADRKSVKYMAWLKTNTATLTDIQRRYKNRSAGFFLSCFKWLQLFQDALFISAECRSVDGINYVEKKWQQVIPWTEGKTKPPQLPAAVIVKIREKLEALRELCTSDDYKNQMIEALKQNLTRLFAEGRHSKVVILVKHPVAVLSVCRFLDGLAGIKCKCLWAHDKPEPTTAHLRDGFDVLVTTWPLLVYHFNGGSLVWDFVIRTDCPYNGLITWGHQGQLEKRELSRFSFDDTPPTFEVDLLLESNIEKTTMEIIELQRNAKQKYNLHLTNVRTSKEERRSWVPCNYENEQAVVESNIELFCHGCGTFVCKESFIRNLDRLRLCLDQNIIHKLETIKHPEQIVFDDGYARLGRFVCKKCGEKWGIVVYVLPKPHLAFSKEGLDAYRDGIYIPYQPTWETCGFNIGIFEYFRDLLRCLPSTFCVDGEPIADLLKCLPTRKETFAVNNIKTSLSFSCSD